MVKHITVADAVLTDVNNAASEIDRVLQAMIYHSRPVYIGVPVDIGTKTISSASLSKPLVTTLPAPSTEEATKVVSEIVDLLNTRKSPVIVVDGGAVRHDIVEETQELINALRVPYFNTAMAKGGISERLGDGKLFGGVYSGGGVPPEPIRDGVEKSDLVLFMEDIRLISIRTFGHG